MFKYNRLHQKGFTLVELLIVVIILAILAAIVIPQFSGSTSDAKNSSIETIVSNMNTAINLYKQEHEHFPATNVSSGGAGCTGTSGTAAQATEAALMQQLAYYSNVAGQTCTVTSASFPYGPYIQGAIPTNARTDIATVTVVTAGDLIMAPAGGITGWRYDTVTGRFIADDQ